VRPLIIERPDLQSRAERYGWLSVTLLCWLLWLYLFVPLLSLLAWALGATVVYRALLADLRVPELLGILASYGTGIGVLTTVYLGWAVSSYLRFRGMDRRRRPAGATLTALAASHHLEVDELRRLRAAPRTVLSAEQLERMFARPAPPPAAPDVAPERRDAAA
jgi:biofilm PGA synthesis protein PgaD